MKRAAWYLAAGAVAGFAGVIGLHGRTAPAAQRAAGNAPGRSQPGPSAPSRAVPAAGASPGGHQPGPSTAAGGAHSAAGAVEHAAERSRQHRHGVARHPATRAVNRRRRNRSPWRRRQDQIAFEPLA